MKKWWKKQGLFLLVFFSLSLLAGTWAYFTDQISVVNEIRMGDVNIQLQEFEEKEGREIPYRNQKMVLPGDRISKIPRITNQAEPCWIRVRAQMEKPVKNDASAEPYFEVSEDWIRRGGYYYYRKILERQASVDFFRQFRIPGEWDESYSGRDFSLTIQAEAIQAAHFIPDFEAMSPWGNEEIEQCVHANGESVQEDREQFRHEIEFDGVAHRLIAISDDFFCNFPTAMPGDELTDYAELSNSTDNTARIYFHTEPLDGGEAAELLQKALLTIQMDGKILYTGELYSEKLEQEILLTELAPSQKDKMEFTVKIPAELKNRYALEKASVKWVFRVEEDQPGKEEKPGNAQSEGQSGTYHSSSSVKTGDDSPVKKYLILLGLGMILVQASLVLVYERRHRK